MAVKSRTLSAKQKRLLQPYLPELLRRYREVAETGQSERDCILCAETGVGRCYICPVFGEFDPDGKPLTKYPFDCTEYLPARPPVCVTVRHDHVRLVGGERADRARGGRDGRVHVTPREQARKWGAMMVQWLESLTQGEETTGGRH